MPKTEFDVQKSVDVGTVLKYVEGMTISLPSIDQMDEALRRRDAAFDGIFYTGVRTTGIFCRPSCPAKKPLRTNIDFFRSVHDALLAGFRPCKRCRPMDRNGASPQWVKRLLAMVDADPTRRWTDTDLQSTSIDPTQARRHFSTHFGMTFQTYHRSRRMGLALAELQRGADIMDVAHRHGFASCSGFRAAFARTFGVPPGAGRTAKCIHTTSIPSPLGPLIAGATDEGVCLLEFTDRRALRNQVKTLQKRLDRSMLPGVNEPLEQLRAELGSYFRGSLNRFTVPMVLPGTPFQQTVWRRLMQIPYGSTTSYGQLARDLNRNGAQRAVARANGDNRLAILIPCHRVVGSDGQLTGYGGGLWRKKFLLDHERQYRSTLAT